MHFVFKTVWQPECSNFDLLVHQGAFCIFPTHSLNCATAGRTIGLRMGNSKFNLNQSIRKVLCLLQLTHLGSWVANYNAPVEAVLARFSMYHRGAIELRTR